MRNNTTIVTLLSAALIGAQALDLDHELEEAKALYRQARFAQALTRLQEIVDRVEQAAQSPAHTAQLADAHLHQALSYIALNDSQAAKQSFKAVLRLDSARRLDPDVYAPKVLALFEEARRELPAAASQAAEARAEPVATPLPASSAGASLPSPGSSKKKGRPVWPFVALGVGGATAAGLAIAGGGAAEPPGVNDIALTALNPASGSVLSIGRARVGVALSVSKAKPGPGVVRVDLRGDCVVSRVTSPAVGPGAQIVVQLTLPIARTSLDTACAGLRPPFRVNALQAVLIAEGDLGSPAAPSLVAKVFRVDYLITE